MHPDSNLSASGTQLEAERRCSQKTNIREGRFELPTKGSLRTQMHTLQSSALPLSYPRCADWLCPVCPASKSNRAQPWEKKHCASTRDRTEDLAVNSRPLCQRSSGGTECSHPSAPPTSGSTVCSGQRKGAKHLAQKQKIPRPGFEPGSRG